MSWAARRRLIIFLILGSVVAVVLLFVSFATLYEAPSCTDHKQNQNETGVDCGGSCAYRCTIEEEPPTVLFTTALTNQEGRTDVVALIENKNTDAAAQNVSYRLKVYGANRVLLQEVTGVVDLPPGARVPVYLPGVVTTRQKVATAFLDIASSTPRWFPLVRDPRILPLVSNIRRNGTEDAPRIDAVLTNPSVQELRDVRVIVIAYDVRGDVVAASQTLVPTIPGQGSATATFVWSVPFSSPVASVQVTPVIPFI